MQHRFIICGVGVACFAIAAATVQAQPRRLSLDVTIGGGSGVGGIEVYRRDGPVVSAIAGLQMRAAGRHAFMVGVGVGYQGLPFSDDVCHYGSQQQCLADFPAVSTFAAFAGAELRARGGASPGATLRVLAGPALVHLDAVDQAGYRGRTVGAQGRIDAATPPLGPIAGVISFGGTAVPRFRGQTLGVWTIGAGLRLR